MVLLREIREHGYSGGITQLKAFINPLKQAKADPVVRFETAPGEQMQADFTVIRRGREPLLAFVATLGYSRASWVRFTGGEDAATLCACVREALLHFGGVPRHVLFDNAKTIIVERDAYGEGKHRWHSALLALSDEYGFGLKVCRPYRAKTKGKVERFNGYLKGSFLVPLAATLKSCGSEARCACGECARGPLVERGGERPRACHDRRTAGPASDAGTFGIAAVAVPERADDLGAGFNRPLPIESLQHPLAVYDALLEVAP